MLPCVGSPSEFAVGTSFACGENAFLFLFAQCSRRKQGRFNVSYVAHGRYVITDSLHCIVDDFLRFARSTDSNSFLT